MKNGCAILAGGGGGHGGRCEATFPLPDATIVRRIHEAAKGVFSDISVATSRLGHRVFTSINREGGLARAGALRS